MSLLTKIVGNRLARLDGATIGRYRLVRRKVRAGFDAAQVGGSLDEHWSRADFLDPNAEATPEVLRRIRSRVRLEFNNNSYCRGIVSTVANYVVGVGPKLRLIPRGEVSQSERRRLYDYANLFNDWFWDIDGPRKLRITCEAKLKDGEGFLMIGTRGRGDIRMTLRPFECDLVTHNDWTRTSGEPDGVVFDAMGDVSGYMVLPRHPGGASWIVYDDKPMEVPAKYVCHWYSETRPGLARGIPEIAPGLRMFAQLGRYSAAVIANAEHAAEINAVLKTQTPPPGGASASVAANTTFDIEHNAILSLPGGWELQQLNPSQPTANHEMFIRTVIREMARGLGVPYAVAAADASGHNYSSMRGDWQGFYEEIKVRRDDAEHAVLEKIRAEFDAEARRAKTEYRELPPHDFYWDWPGYEHVDPAKVANAQETRLRNNTTTLAREFAKEGLFYEDEIRQRHYERTLTKGLEEASAVAHKPEPREDGNDSDD